MVTPLAIGLLQLILLWRLGAQSIARGMWSRRTYRIRPAWDVRVDGEAASIVDASLSGLGVVSARDDIAVGAHPPVSVTFPDGTGVAGRGIVVRAQKRPVGTVLGLSLEVTPEQRTSWMVHLLQDRSLSEPEGVGQAADFETSRSWRARVERVGQAVVILAGTVVFLAVALLGLGYRPLTIVSPSMRPTLSIGDVVIEQRATISSVRVGDIVTVPSSVTGGSSLTHRVRSISLDGSSVRLETRGDANTTSELFIVPRDTMVGKVVLKVPVVGRVLRRLSSQPVQWFAYGLAALLVAIIGLRQLTGPTSAKPASARPASARPASASVDHGGKDESEDVAYRIDAAPPHSASTAVPVGVEDRGSAIQGAGGDGGLDDASPRPNPAWQTS